MRLRACLAVLASLALVAGCRHATAIEPQAPASVLELGRTVNGALAEGQEQRFRLRVPMDRYAVLVVEGERAPLDPALRDARGASFPPLEHGRERVFFIAGDSGPLVLHLRRAHPVDHAHAEDSRYKVVTVVSFAPPSQQERCLAAERAFNEGRFAATEGTPEALQRALARYEAALTLWVGLQSLSRAAATLEELGLAHGALAEHEPAARRLEEAGRLWQGLGDLRAQVRNLYLRALLHARQGENGESRDLQLRALSLGGKLDEPLLRAQVLNALAAARVELGETREALHDYLEALGLGEAAKDAAEEARSLAGLGRVYALLGESQKALESSSKAVARWQSLGDMAAEAASLNNVGFVYQALGDYDEALRYYLAALERAGKQHDRLVELYALLSVGSVHQALGSSEAALASFQSALALSRMVHHRGLEAVALSRAGRIHAHLGHAAEALAHYDQALRLSRETASSRDVAATLTDMGRAHLDLGQPDKAGPAFSEALARARASADAIQEATVLAALATMDRRRGDLASARQRLEESLALLESPRMKTADLELRSTYWASRQGYYGLYVQVLMDLEGRRPGEGYAARALQAVERARARSLLEMLGEEREEIRKGVRAELLERQRQLRGEIGRRAVALQLARDPLTAEAAGRLTAEIRDLTRDHQRGEAEVRASSPSYAALTQPVLLDIEQIQREVLDEETALLSYWLGEEESHAWLVTSSSVSWVPLPPRSDIEAMARRLYNSLLARNDKTVEARHVFLARADADYDEAAQALAEMLLAPLWDRLIPRRLLIVADGALQYIPFGLLPEPAWAASGPEVPLARTPLISRHEVVVAPSASVLTVLRREAAGRPPALKAVAVLADPIFDADDPRLRAGSAARNANGSTTRGGAPAQPVTLRALIESARPGEGGSESALVRLHNSRAEAQAVLRFVRPGQSLLALDHEASRALALSPTLAEYRVVHFATHGLVNSQRPEMSGLVLSLVDEAGRPQDGFLSLYDIYNLDLRADLVVLSACQTALGREIRGEGLVGLTRGFMYAGAPRVVASLWSVDDEATAELMARFYQKMLDEGRRPAAALREAQLSMLGEDRWRHPYYWGAFVLIGEWR